MDPNLGLGGTRIKTQTEHGAVEIENVVILTVEDTEIAESRITGTGGEIAETEMGGETGMTIPSDLEVDNMATGMVKGGVVIHLQNHLRDERIIAMKAGDDHGNVL